MLPVGEIICGDCLDIMRTLPDGCIDAVITDPPYGIGAPNITMPDSNGRLAKTGKADRFHHLPTDFASYGGTSDWDSKPLDAARFAEIQRIAPLWALFGADYYSDILPAGRQWIIWDKQNDGTIFSHVELVCTSRKGPNKIIRHLWNGICREGGEDKYHPTGKPERLMCKLIEMLTKPGDLICDPFCGSGTTPRAAERMGRRWIGVDIDPHWCAIARKRTAQKGLDFMEQSQLAE